MISQNKNLRIPIKNVLIALAVVVGLSAITGTVYWKLNSKKSFDGTAGVSKINYDPPTKQEQEAANTQKQQNIDRQDLNTKDTPSTASVFITDATYYSDSNKVEIRAYVSNLFEDGGTCTATLTNGSQTVTHTSSAFKVATNTQCGAIDIPRAEFTTAGTWNLLLEYSSPTATGTQQQAVKL